MSKDFLYRPSRILFLILVVIVVCFAINIFYIYLIYNDSRTNTRIINYFSELRDLIQEVETLELKHNNTDNLIAKINQIFADFKVTIDKISLFQQDQNISQRFTDLQEIWQELYDTIKKYRRNGEQILSAQIIALSERCEVLVDNIFSEAEISLGKNQRNLIFIIITFIVINGILILLIGFIVKKYISEKLEYMASHDQLTLLLNRFIYKDILEKEIAQAFRNNSSLSLILFDIDFFKKINDRHGHDAGDEVLCLVAKTVNKCIRKSDYLFRIGGEEFAIVAGATASEQAAFLCEKIRRTVMKPNKKYGEITLSLGLAELAKEDTPELLFKKADTALYKAKETGRNRVEVYNSQ